MHSELFSGCIRNFLPLRSGTFYRIDPELFSSSIRNFFPLRFGTFFRMRHIGLFSTILIIYKRIELIVIDCVPFSPIKPCTIEIRSNNYFLFNQRAKTISNGFFGHPWKLHLPVVNSVIYPPPTFEYFG